MSASNSSTALIARPVWPFATETEALRAANQYIAGRLPAVEKRRLLSRLLITYNYAEKFVGTLAQNLAREDLTTRHQFLDYFNLLLDRHLNLSSIAIFLAEQAADVNYALREKAAMLLLKMRTQAAPAIPRLLTNLRAKISDIQLNSLHILASIGSECREVALPKIIRLLGDTTISQELRNVAERARQVISGEVEWSPTATLDFKPTYPALTSKNIWLIDEAAETYQQLAELCGQQRIGLSYAESAARFDDLLYNAIRAHLIIVSTTLPGRKATDILHALRERSLWRSVPIFVSATELTMREMLRYAHFEIAGFVKKPFNLPELLLRLNNALTVENAPTLRTTL